MLRFKICNLFFSSSVASCQQAMVIVPAMASSAENKRTLEVVSVPAKASSASKPSGATEPSVSENKRKLEASGEAVQKAMRGGRKQLQDEAKNDGGVIEVDDWFEEMEGVIDEGVQLEEMEDVDLFFHHLVSY